MLLLLVVLLLPAVATGATGAAVVAAAATLAVAVAAAVSVAAGGICLSLLLHLGCTYTSAWTLFEGEIAGLRDVADLYSAVSADLAATLAKLEAQALKTWVNKCKETTQVTSTA